MVNNLILDIQQVKMQFLLVKTIVLDYFAWKIIGKERMFNHGLSSRKHENALLFKYAKELGLGKPADFHAKRIR